jgi:hypothetical protein
MTPARLETSGAQLFFLYEPRVPDKEQQYDKNWNKCEHDDHSDDPVRQIALHIRVQHSTEHHNRLRKLCEHHEIVIMVVLVLVR